MTFSATLDRTVQLYRAHFAPLLVIAVVGGLPQIPFAIAIDPGDRQPPTPHFSPRAAILALLSALVVVVSSGALAKAALAIHDGKPIGFRQAYRASLSRLPTLLGAAVLTVLLTAVGALLLIIPAFYVLFGLSFSYLVAMGEGHRAWRSLTRSWALADGRRIHIFGLLFIWGLLQVVLSYAVSGALGLFGLGPVVGKVGQQLAGILVAPCYSLALCLTYFAARADKEGLDLAQEAQRLAAAAGSSTAKP